MIAELQPGAKSSEIFSDLAAALLGRTEIRKSRGSLLEPLLAKLARRKAS
jgi:pilus assembly protein CpaE